MSSALEILDIVQTLSICACLVLTFPCAFFVYFKLIFFKAFSNNYTFKLIVLNGLLELLNCVAYLFAYQLISYPFMIVFYTSLQQTVPNSLAITFAFTSGLSLNTSLFIALNRLKTIMFIRRQSDDSIFFLISVAISTFLTLPAVLDLCFWTTVRYIPITYNDAVIMVPNNVINNETLRRVSDVIRIVVSLATLVVNIILFFLIARERKFLDISDRQKLNGERGLVLTSIVSYTFYMLYFVNSVLARYLNIVICGFVQWMFLGLNAITPFWYVGSVKMVPSPLHSICSARGISNKCRDYRNIHFPAIYDCTKQFDRALVRKRAINSLSMSSALEIFDVFQTIGISLCLAITIPFACFIYYKLIFTGPFSESYTFKLIVLNGITELLNCIAYLIAYQLISYPFMAGMYTFLQNTGIVAPLTISSCFLAGFSLHTSLFIALNRLKTIMFIRQRNNDSTFFFISVISSTVLTGPAVTDLCLFTTIIYASFTYNDETIMYPKNNLTNNSLRVVSDIIRIFVSLATLVINIILSVMITRERKFINFAERQKQVFARYFDMLIFGYAQWLFLGFNAMTPFWCLLLFTPSIRRLVPQITIQPRATTIRHSSTSAHHNTIDS